ncbi:MAG: type II toxin-antitoxin system RelE family toxin [Geminicoccaceae bacterium]
MTWKLIFSNSARRNLRKLPLNDRRRIDRALDELALDPSLGDVLPLRNHPTEFRKRVGDYRIFFDLQRHQRLVWVHDILRRTSKTYRRR